MKKSYSSEELSEKQVEFEIAMKLTGIERFHANNQRSIDDGVNSETVWNRRIIQELIDPMSKAINAYVAYYTGKPGKPSLVLRYIQMMAPEQASYIAIKNIIDSLTKETELMSLSLTIGRRLEDQVRFSNLEELAPKYVAKVHDNLKRARSQSYTHKKNVLVHAEKALNEESKAYEPVKRWVEWPKKAAIQVGAKLIDIFMENVLFEGEPVVYKGSNSVKEGEGKIRSRAYIAPSEHIGEWISKYKEVMEALNPSFAPCVIPPKEWTNQYDGGYHIPEVSDTLPLVKGRKSQVRRLTRAQMPEVYRAVNHLQNTPWQVSDSVLEVAEYVIDNNLELAIPSREAMRPDPAPIPAEHSKLSGKELKEALSAEEYELYLAWRREAGTIYSADRKRSSKFIQCHRTATSARKYAEFERLYFVYTMDSRGRVYCKSDGINPQGDDFQKGLIKFANGRELGANGRYWLAVHGANVYGNDKVSFDDRVKFIDEITEDIRDIACDPCTFTSWVGTDKPWQFLNWCFEWAALIDHEEDGNDSNTFVSYIPCGMDGSCSGIQHYSAILRDPIGGAAVNLVPDEKPHDIYGDVAKVVEAKMREDALTSEDEEKKLCAQGWLSIVGGINRKLTKSPVMTLPYGSTRMRCTDTTAAFLMDLQEEENKKAQAEGREPVRVHQFGNADTDIVPLYTAVSYGAGIIWSSIGEVVKAARDGMSFIQGVAREVARQNSHLEWVTPTGFIVEQLELEYKSRRVDTQIQGLTRFRIAEETDQVNVYKMKSASAPNFIHSMDASHLVKLTNVARDLGLDMACIHDDFGTHAGATVELRDILVTTFSDLYLDHDVLAEFKEHNEWLISQEINIPVPGGMGLDLNEVKRSTYCFA